MGLFTSLRRQFIARPDAFKAEIVFKTIAHATAVRDLVRQHQEP